MDFKVRYTYKGSNYKSVIDYDGSDLPVREAEKIISIPSGMDPKYIYIQTITRLD